MFFTETESLRVFLENGCSYNSCSATLQGESVTRIFENTKESIHFSYRFLAYIFTKIKTIHRYFRKVLAPRWGIAFLQNTSLRLLLHYWYLSRLKTNHNFFSHEAFFWVCLFINELHMLNKTPLYNVFSLWQFPSALNF